MRCNVHNVLLNFIPTEGRWVCGVCDFEFEELQKLKNESLSEERKNK